MKNERKVITILLTDIRGFTCLMERLELEDIAVMLNHYFAIMEGIVHKYQGTVIDCMGDAILAIFGAPLDDPAHPGKAAACAIEMQLAMTEVNAWNADKGFPSLEMGIGINTGETLVGHIGSPGNMKYNVLGQTVNLVSRIESYTTGMQIMLSENTKKAVSSPLNIVQSLEVQAKGIAQPVALYEIDGIGAPYNLSLPKTDQPLKKLAKPVPLACCRILDKLVDPAVIPCTLRAWSDKKALIMPEDPKVTFALFENLRLVLDSAGPQVLAKVVKKQKDGAVLARFTAAAEDFCRALTGKIP
jgi:adenylate cyclase